VPPKLNELFRLKRRLAGDPITILFAAIPPEAPPFPIVSDPELIFNVPVKKLLPLRIKSPVPVFDNELDPKGLSINAD
jgi:hypothetical protein